MHYTKMNTIIMNSKNSKASDPHRLLLNLANKIDLRRKDNILIYQILSFTIHGKIWKISYKNNKFKVSTPTCNEEFELPNRSYSTPDIQGYF